MQKAVAVPYVIALIIGVAVIALIGIWFVTSGGKFSGASSETLCRGKAVEFCSRYLASADQTITNWGTVKGSVACDSALLTSLGIKHSSEDRPDCSKILK